jgi:UPF0176 protein
MYLVAALYRFAPLDKLSNLRAELLELCAASEVKGTLLLAEEGINGTIAGSEPGVRRVLDRLSEDPRLADMNLKESWSERLPFREMKVRIKQEIVTIAVPGLNPREKAGTYVQPDDWNALVRDPDVVLVDARNAYESDIGSFKGAVLTKTSGFREFPAWLRDQSGIPKDQKVAMFCTGGVRCEKATAHLLAEGYAEVFHLKGGILKYLEQIPVEQSLWEGDCFVFDERVSVDHNLAPGDHVMCPACGRAVDAVGRAQESYIEGVSCPGCVGETTEDQKARFAERQRQVELAEARGDLHLGAVFPPPKPPVADQTGPILYSFRRCPYAIRARMALATSAQVCRLREVVLRDKPPSLVEISPKATVPVLQLPDGTVIEESLEIMQWALDQGDPEGWLQPETGSMEEVLDLIGANDGDFKAHLDRYKYATRFDGVDPLEHRQAAEVFLARLNQQLESRTFLFGARPCLADMAIAPFIRQFASADREWFDSTPYPNLQTWLKAFLASKVFTQCMKKHKQWHSGDRPILFPPQQET